MENIVSMVTLVNWKSPVISLLMKIETCNLEAHLRKFQFFIRQKTHYFFSKGSSFYETSKVGHFWRWTERGPANLKFMTPILKPLYSLSPWWERTTFSRQPPLPSPPLRQHCWNIINLPSAPSRLSPKTYLLVFAPPRSGRHWRRKKNPLGIW